MAACFKLLIYVVAGQRSSFYFIYFVKLSNQIHQFTSHLRLATTVMPAGGPSAYLAAKYPDQVAATGEYIANSRYEFDTLCDLNLVFMGHRYIFGATGISAGFCTMD